MQSVQIAKEMVQQELTSQKEAYENKIKSLEAEVVSCHCIQHINKIGEKNCTGFLFVCRLTFWWWDTFFFGLVYFNSILGNAKPPSSSLKNNKKNQPYLLLTSSVSITFRIFLGIFFVELARNLIVKLV